MITLSCRPSDSLDWDFQTIPKEGTIFWRFDLGLEDPFFPIDDEMRFASLSLALTKFTQEIWPIYQERTFGAVLYRGSAEFSWGEPQTHVRRISCANAFANYFQMLAHRLPDEMPLYLLLDATGLGSLAERHHLLSRERFEHFLVATKGLAHTNGLLWEGEGVINPQVIKASEALCLPTESMCSGEVLQRLETQMKRIKKPFRVISEAFLTEDWEGVDILHVLRGTLTIQGERKIKGFEAAGGVVIFDEP